ncbi:MAG TPA: response regulator [Bacteroidales bacterium]|nr:response regulator [Bacteroidales bacterium]
MAVPSILIVDDDQAIRELLNEFFRGLNYDTTCAENGAAALSHVSCRDFDCIVSDHLMPDMDGLELLAHLREQDKKIPFLMVTGYPSIETAVEVMKQGAYDYITKPLVLEDVRIKVERAVHTKGLERSVRKLSGIAWAILISIPIWLILGIVVGKVWRYLIP